MADCIVKVVHIDDDLWELDKVEEDLHAVAIGAAYQFEVRSFQAVNQFLSHIKQATFDVAIIDVHISDLSDPSESGLLLAKMVRQLAPRAAILMRSNDVGSAMSSLKNGADDFIDKASAEGAIGWRIISILHMKGFGFLAPKNISSSTPNTTGSKCIGKTVKSLEVRIPRIISSAIGAVHVVGESGTGKEVVADLFESAMSAQTPFVRVNCGAIPESLLDAVLFGHAKGAFTGAANESKGLLEAASGGWIFLDEIANLSLPAQAALLRAIENQEITRIGENKPRKTNFRVLSATNESLEDLVRRGKFRNDLWQRLCETEIVLPPLRDRPDEIRDLVVNFCSTGRGGPYRMSSGAMAILVKLDWQRGNIRELRNCIRAMTENHIDGLLTPMALPLRIWEQVEKAPQRILVPDDAPQPEEPTKRLGEYKIFWETEKRPDFDTLCDFLLLEIIREAGARTESTVTLRDLSIETGLARSTVSLKIKSMIERGVISRDEVLQYVNLRS